MIKSIKDLSGQEIEKLYLKGKLDHLKNQRLSTQQIKEMRRAKIPDMIQKGIIYSEPSPI